MYRWGRTSGGSGGVQEGTDHSAAARQASARAEGSGHGMNRQASYDQALQQEFVLESGVTPTGSFSIDMGQAHIIVEEPKRPLSWSDFVTYFKRLPTKLRGEFAFAFLGSFLGMLSVCALNQWVTPEIDLPLLVGSFGASAVLLFAVVESKLSQPLNFLGGQVLSAFVGVLVRLAIPVAWIAQPVAVSLAILAMMLSSTTHPPGGATALIVVALIVNNLNPARSYPTFWF